MKPLLSPDAIKGIKRLQYEYELSFKAVLKDGRWDVNDFVEIGKAIEFSSDQHIHRLNSGKNTKAHKLRISSQSQFNNQGRALSKKDGVVHRNTKIKRNETN